MTTSALMTGLNFGVDVLKILKVNTSKVTSVTVTASVGDPVIVTIERLATESEGGEIAKLLQGYNLVLASSAVTNPKPKA